MFTRKKSIVRRFEEYQKLFKIKNLLSTVVTEYFKMPDINLFADYDRCMALSPHQNSPAYCVVNTFIKPDPLSELYNYIKDFSKLEKQHFRHDKLHRGICVKDCLSLVKELGSEAKNYFVEKFPMDANLTIDNFKYRFIDEDRSSLDEVMNICVNHELAKFNLSGYSTIDFCMRHDESIPKGKQLIILQDLEA